MTTVDRSGSARERLLEAASELFYGEGVNTVGIDRVIERAGVAKASLYKIFGSKDELIWAYLMEQHDATKTRMADALLTRYATPRERLLGVFEVQSETYSAAEFRGCAFANATAEASAGSRISGAATVYREWLHGLFTDLAGEAGAPDPVGLARQLVLVYDGASVSARMDRDAPTVAAASRRVAAALIEASLGPSEPRDRPPVKNASVQKPQRTRATSGKRPRATAP